MTQEEVAAVLSRSTRVSIGLILAGLIPLFAGVLVVQSTLSRIQFDIASIKLDAARTAQQLEQAAEDRWRRAEMRQWVETLQVRNPTLEVPPVGERF